MADSFGLGRHTVRFNFGGVGGRFVLAAPVARARLVLGEGIAELTELHGHQALQRCRLILGQVLAPGPRGCGTVELLRALLLGSDRVEGVGLHRALQPPGAPAKAEPFHQ
jgi:hypothetical protein